VLAATTGALRPPPCDPRFLLPAPPSDFLLTGPVCSISLSPHEIATIAGSILPHATIVFTNELPLDVKPPPPDPELSPPDLKPPPPDLLLPATASLSLSLFEFLASPYYECQGDGMPYLG
jgi:hypothetical protein